jgi:metal-sulfur cluster biosynthetic enzyme
MTQSPHPKVVWDVEITHPELVETLKIELRSVVDPEIGLNVVELGLIRNVTISEDHAIINMIMTTPFCPYAPAILEMARKKGEDALKVPTSIALGFEPWEPSMMEEGAGAEWGFF